jgi:glycosyltransferase involved in cell wall biosynthesis
LEEAAMPRGERVAAPEARERAGGGGDRELAVAIVGMSATGACGVRDHSAVLASALAHEGVAGSRHWLDREDRSLRADRVTVGDWSATLSDDLRAGSYDAVVWEYSVFAHSYRGLPVFVAPTLAALRRAGLPLVGFMHELVYPWRLGGARGRVWAATQRAVLPGIVRACEELIVTADFRASWLRRQRWLAPRPLALAPVFSNLPRPSEAESARSARAGAESGRVRVGTFGYVYGSSRIALVLDALRLLERRGPQPRLALLGAPGRDSLPAQRWLAAARARALEPLLDFEGPLPPQQISDAIAACDVLLFADPPGPTSRKGTLAAALASGRPLVALDGPRTWSAPVRDGALRLVEPQAGALATALERLLADRPGLECLGARGRAFYEAHMDVARTAAVVRDRIELAVTR